MRAPHVSQPLVTLGVITIVGGVALMFSVIFAGSGVMMIVAGAVLVLLGESAGLVEHLVEGGLLGRLRPSAR